MIEMQGDQKASDSMEVKRQKGKTIDAVHNHGSIMLSLGQAQIPGPTNINHIHRLRQVLRQKGYRQNCKKSMASMLEYLRWEDEKVFQST